MPVSRKSRQADVVLGEDWTGPDSSVAKEVRVRRERRGFISLNRSPLARKIIIFNLLALIFLVASVLFLNQFRDSLVIQREIGLVAEAELIADVFEAQLPRGETIDLSVPGGLDGGFDVVGTLAGLDLPIGVEVFVFVASEVLLATTI
ncbi:MAG: sensor N-terminal transmembrane domain-containing protein, partial [Halocynthiibacter sp.]